LPLVAGAIYGFAGWSAALDYCSPRHSLRRRTWAFGRLHYHYFFAVRQFIFVVPALTLWPSTGCSKAAARPSGRLVLLFLGGALAKNYTYFSRPHEDVAVAARLLLDTAAQSPCIAYVPTDDHGCMRCSNRPWHSTAAHGRHGCIDRLRLEYPQRGGRAAKRTGSPRRRWISTRRAAPAGGTTSHCSQAAMN